MDNGAASVKGGRADGTTRPPHEDGDAVRSLDGAPARRERGHDVRRAHGDAAVSVRAARDIGTAYLGTCALAAFAAPALEGVANAIIVATATVVSRFVPTLALAYFVFATTTVSEFMAAMASMRMPDWITIPLSVLFRFFPTLGQEARAVNAAMRMRGITPLSRGIAYAENCLVPLMSCAVSIGEDLSAAALARGLGAPWPRTNTGNIGFTPVDAAVIAASLAATATLALGLVFPEAIA